MTTSELTSDDALVLFEFLAREIYDRKGAKLADAIESGDDVDGRQKAA